MTPAPAPQAVRQPGLDTLRALAILLVFAYHYRILVSETDTFGWASAIGWTGVDLFFVLSGYLIAHPLLAGLLRGQPLSPGRFYLRRALRTLPNFHVLLALYTLFPGEMGGREAPPLWRFLSFTQNIGLAPGTAFSHAWSLCIEEQFYLVLPVALLAWFHLPLQPRQRLALAWTVLATLTAAAIAWRSALWLEHGREGGGGYYPHIYYATLCRVDEFLPGVALALLRHGHPQAWARLTQSPAAGRAVFALAVAATLAVLWAMLNFYERPGEGYGYAMTGFGYSLVAWSFGLLVLSALCAGSPLQRLRIPGAASLALWSYALYLTHKPVATVLDRALAPWDLPPGVLATLISLACLVAGWLLYRCVEAPVMRWRDRRWPAQAGSVPSPPDSARGIERAAATP